MNESTTFFPPCLPSCNVSLNIRNTFWFLLLMTWCIMWLFLHCCTFCAWIYLRKTFCSRLNQFLRVFYHTGFVYTKTILGTFSTMVFSGNLKRQTARSHVTKPCGHVRSCQRRFSTPRSRFSRKWLTWTFCILNFCLCHVPKRKLCKQVFLVQV